MAQVPRGAPFIDLLAPAGTAAQVTELQTRLDLVTGGGWRVIADDGTFETSSVPSQPLRGKLDRVWLYRTTPMAQGEDFQDAGSLALELALMSQAKVAAAGVYGLYAWGLVAFEDLRWLHGLLLLDWLYNPRLDELGEVVEAPEPETAAATVEKKLAVFQALWTPENAVELGKMIPPGAVQQVESHQVLSLLGPGGSFDPRYWQSLAMQLVLPAVRAHVAGGAPAPSMSGAPASPVPLAPPAAPAPPPPPSDGLTPLARAAKEARERAALAAEQGAAEPEEAEAPEGTPISWSQTSRGPVLFLPEDRYDPSLLRRLRSGSTNDLVRSERPDGSTLDGWMESGAPFVTEVPFASRLFLNDKPLHKSAFGDSPADAAGARTLVAHLPRVSRVRAVLVAPEGAPRARVLASSDVELSADEIRGVAGI